MYAPADVLLRSLDKFGEIDRLRRLRHTGALELVLPGIPHSRWDYVASMLFSAWRLDLESPTTTTKFGDTSFSSMRAIIQCAALLSSMGHLPGTFSTEKGLTQWLFKESSESPTSLLPWPEHLEPRERKQLIEQADEFLARTDYAGLNRILSLVRILGFLVQGSNDRNELLHNLVYDFYLPFLFPERRAPERVELWEKIEANYQTVRHISYLNLDAAFANVPVRVDVTGLLGGSLRLRHSESSDTERDHQSSVDRIEHAREVLGAYEHSVFEDLYHSERARKCTAVVAHLVREELQRSADPMKTLTDWLHRSDLEDIVNRRALRAAMDEFKTIVGISVRTHLLSVPPSQKILAEQEEEFTYSLSTVTSPNIKSLSIIVTYQPWEREQHLEPAHVYIRILRLEALLHQRQEVAAVGGVDHQGRAAVAAAPGDEGQSERRKSARQRAGFFHGFLKTPPGDEGRPRDLIRSQQDLGSARRPPLATLALSISSEDAAERSTR